MNIYLTSIPATSITKAKLITCSLFTYIIYLTEYNTKRWACNNKHNENYKPISRSVSFYERKRESTTKSVLRLEETQNFTNIEYFTHIYTSGEKRLNKIICIKMLTMVAAGQKECT